MLWYSFVFHKDLKISTINIVTFVFTAVKIYQSLKSQAAATGALKHGREKPPHVRGQGQKPGGPHARRAAAKRSYPTSEVRGSGWEYQTATAQERWRGATPRPRSGARLRRDTQRPRSGAVARKKYPRPQPRGQGWRVGGATLRPRSPGCAGAGGPRGAIPRWRSGRAAVRRYPMPKVRETRVRR